MNKITAGFAVFAGAALAICFGAAQYAKGYYYEGGNMDIGFGQTKLSNTQEFLADDIKNIYIEYKSQNIYFYKGEGDKIVIKEYLGNGKRGDMVAKGDTLSVMGAEGTISIFSFHFAEEKVEIFLPEDYHGCIKVSSSSGNIKTRDALELSVFAAGSKSGNISCAEVTAEEIVASASSGSVVFQKAQGNRRIMTSSGSINVKGGEGNTAVSSKSGNITIMDAAGKLDASASSGSVKVEFVRAEEDINIETSSGNIRLNLLKDSAFKYEGKSSSGIIRTDFDDKLTFNDKRNAAKGSYGEDSNICIRTTASSGSTRITLK